MADKGRDFKISILSDADKFDLSQPAQELEDLGDKAKQSADKVDRSLSDMGRKDLDRFGDKAATTAKKVDSAFDKIAASSKSNLRQVDRDAKKAEQGLDNLADEAGQSGREAAASFSGGFDDVTDFVQETVANGFAGMGKVGMGAGLAAAAGIGFLVSALQAAQEKINNISTSLVDLKIDGLDDTASRIKAITDEMRDSGDLTRFAAAAKTAGIDFGDYVRAMANGGPEFEAMKQRLDDLANGYGGLSSIGGAGAAAQDLSNRMHDQATAAEAAGIQVDALKETTEGLTEGELAAEEATKKATAAQEAKKAALDNTLGSISAVADASSGLSSIVQEEAQKQADATKDPKDSWADYADGVKLSSDDIIETLNEQTKAATEFRDNLLVVQKQGDAEFTAWVSKQPAAVAAAYKGGTAKERSGIYAAWKRNVGAAAGDGIAEGMESKKPRARSAAAGVHEDMKAELKRRIDVPVGVDGPSRGELANIRAGIKSGLSGITVGVEAIAKTTFRSAP